jgi:hypothetical protein
MLVSCLKGRGRNEPWFTLKSCQEKMIKTTKHCQETSPVQERDFFRMCLKRARCANPPDKWHTQFRVNCLVCQYN